MSNLYTKVLQEHEHFLLKKKQYAKAMHIFHDQTGDIDRVIDDLPVKEMDAVKKEYTLHERSFHDISDSFDRALDDYKKIIGQIAPKLKKPVVVSYKNKKIKLSVGNGELIIEPV